MHWSGLAHIVQGLASAVLNTGGSVCDLAREEASVDFCLLPWRHPDVNMYQRTLLISNYTFGISIPGTSMFDGSDGKFILYIAVFPFSS